MSNQDNTKVEVIVTLKDGFQSQIKGISDQLKGHGFETSMVMEHSGLLAGLVSQSAIGKLNKIQGIASVELAGSAFIPPPDNDIQ